jgi:hypothetical protein
MLKTIIDSVVEKFEDAGVENVYSSFDACPVEKKGSLFTVVGIGALETSAPIYTLAYAYIPFKYGADINVTASKSMSADELCSYYQRDIEPVLLSMTDLECSLKKLSLKFDSNIQRLVLNVKADICGITRIERSIS